MKKVLAALLCATALFAQSVGVKWSTTVAGTPSAVVISTVTNTVLLNTTSVYGAGAKFLAVDTINIVNNSASSVSVQFFDLSTNCGGGACPFTPSYLVPANTEFTVPKGGQPSPGGISVIASSPNAIYTWVSGKV